MKLFSSILFGWLAAMLLLVGCTSNSSYATLLKEQKATIATFLKYDTISTISSLPTNYWASTWPNKQYYLSSTGLYYRLLQPGDQELIDTQDSVRIGDNIIVRYVKIDITMPPDTVESTWTTLNAAYPVSITYGSSSSEPTGWQEAISYMKYSGAIAEMIIPGSLGTSTDQSNVTPYYYKIIIRRLPR